MLVFERIHPDAIVPTKGSSHAACYDLYSTSNGWVVFSYTTIFSTGIKMAIPRGYMGHIVPRSGLARYSGIQVMGGIIDSDYRGEIKVILTKVTNDSTYKVMKGDRIAQLLIIPNPTLMACEGKVGDATERGSAGFGSTGR